jgi:uncharacterized protein
MDWRRGVGLSLIFLLAVSSILAGCTAPTGDDDREPDGARVEWPRCEHPWPCGDGLEWPENLTGPFERLPPERVQVLSFDGIMLDGAIWVPDVPDGTSVPTVLYTSPYLGQCFYQTFTRPPPACVTSPENDDRLNGYGLRGLITEGYAVAVFSVRGSGASGGCYDMWGSHEQQDHALLVEWLADQPWSNGRVGMVGLSYSGATPWEAAILAPQALKAFVVGGIVTDPYLGDFSPQGAAHARALHLNSGTIIANSLLPPAIGEPLSMLPHYAPNAHERACPESVRTLTAHQESALSDERDVEWYAERRLIDHFDAVTAAPLVLHGLQDLAFQRHQQDLIWNALPYAPKGVVLGQWGHTTNLAEYLESFAGGDTWAELQLEWFDFFLKGVGEPPATLGRVQYQDSALIWYNSTAWPPAESRNETLFLNGGSLAPEPGTGDRSLSLTPVPFARTDCQAGTPDPVALMYATEPRESQVVVAGNPFAWLTVSADRPRGQFGVGLFDLSPEFTCDGEGTARWVASTGVDLAFHQDGITAKSFPTDTPTKVRVDFHNVAHALEPGHRLALAIHNPTDLWIGMNDGPTLTVHGGTGEQASHLVLPIIKGTFDGPSPVVDYPPRPFDPTAR